jgi:phage shock protein PspC (stress-responsive transcriptional regulator)
MNKTVTVNIGGIVFHIDENAYERFKQYLESIRVHFTGSDGSDEIMQDIESRIAEMFQERIKDSKQVITLNDVEEVTAVMGKPEQFGDEEAKEEKTSDNATLKVKRRLFRNPDDKVLGGVCSGISAYFDIDPVWIRLAFAVAFFFGGSGFLLYLILWIVIPKAVTTADKLQMKGEPVNVSNIERNVQEELDHLKRKITDPSVRKKSDNFIARFFDGIGQLLRFIFIFIGKVLAAFLVFIGLIVAFAMFASLLTVFNVPGAQYPEFLNQIFQYDYQFSLALIGAVIVVGIPFLMLAYFGARVLFKINKSSRAVKMSVLGLWLAGLLICIYMGADIANEFSEKQSIRKEINLSHPPSKVLYLKVDKERDKDKYYDRWDEEDWNGPLRLSLNKDELQSNDIKLDIVESETDSFQLVQVCYARGATKKEAADHATHISYSFDISDSILSFQPYFVLDKKEKYRAQRMQLILKVPKGSTVYFDKSLRGFIYDIQNVGNILDNDMLKHKWEMRDNGLTCLDCDGTEASLDDEFRFQGKSGESININNNGIYIRGSEDEVVSIDSNGVVIFKDGKKKVIDKNNIKITIEE